MCVCVCVCVCVCASFLRIFCVAAPTNYSRTRWVCGKLSIPKRLLANLEFQLILATMRRERLLSPLACLELKTLLSRLPAQNVQHRLLWQVSAMDTPQHTRFEQILVELSVQATVGDDHNGDEVLSAQSGQAEHHHVPRKLHSILYLV